MLSDAQRENTRIVLRQLVDLWEHRSGSYGNVLFCSAVARGQDGKWRNVTSVLLPLHKEERPSSGTWDYGEFKLVKGTMPLREAKVVLSEVVDRDRLCLPALPEVVIQASLHPNSPKHFWQSGQRRYPLLFPYYEFSFSAEQESKGESPGLLHHLDLPLFPSGGAAMEHFFDVHIGDDSSSYSGWFAALAPDYRGRIREVRLGASSVEVQIACPEGHSQGDLVGKLYSKSHDGIAECADLSFADGKAVRKISNFPRSLLTTLLSRKEGDLVDRRQFFAGSRYVEGDVVIETPGQDIEQIIQMGESETAEFKREIPPKNKEVIAIGAVALANRRGGQILIGVSDNCEIVGCRMDKPKESITQILRSHCDPPFDVFVEEVNVRDLPVIVMTVPAGRDKPYAVKDRGVYVRAGASNRIATRYELDEMYGSKQSPFGE